MSLKKRGKVWSYRFRFAGRVIHESSKSTSRTVAKEAERARRRELEESYNHVKKNALPPSFEKASDAWMKSREGHVASATSQIGSESLKHLLPVFGSKLLCDISPRHIEAYQTSRLKEGAQGRTVNIEVQTMRQVLKANKCWKHLEAEGA